MDPKTKYYEVTEFDKPEVPVPPEPGPPIEPEPPVAEEGYIVLEGPVSTGPDTFKVNIVGGTNAQVDGYSIFVGYPDGLQALGFEPGEWVEAYLDGRTPFQIFQPWATGSVGAVPSQHVGIQCGFWENGADTALPVTVPQDTVLGTLLFKWTKPGAYFLDNASRKYGRNKKLPAMYTRLTGRFIAPTLGSLTVEVPIT